LNHRNMLRAVVGHVKVTSRSVWIEHAHLHHQTPLCRRSGSFVRRRFTQRITASTTVKYAPADSQLPIVL
jgi:hypothetical protein